MGSVHLMQKLSERQEKARALTNELQKQFSHCVFVTSPLPLNPDAKLRLQLLNWPSSNYENTLEVIRSWGWTPILTGHGMRFCADYTARGCSNFEIDIPADHQPIEDDRAIPRSEIEEKRSTPTEVELVKKHLGLK
jgi:hypothetical protein